MLDATTVKQPGTTESLWRLHYSVRLPSLASDLFRLTATKAVGTGEFFRQFSGEEDDYLLDHCGFSTARRLLDVERRAGEHCVAALTPVGPRAIRPAGEGQRSSSRRDDWLVAGPGGR